MISRRNMIRRRSAYELCSKRGFAAPSFSSGLGSRLLKTAEKDPKLKPPDSADPTDVPKRTSIFSRPTSNIPNLNAATQNKGIGGNGIGNNVQAPKEAARPRFSMSAAIQNHGARKIPSDTWKPATPQNGLNAPTPRFSQNPLNNQNNQNSQNSQNSHNSQNLNRPAGSTMFPPGRPAAGLGGASSIRDHAKKNSQRDTVDNSPRPILKIFGASDIFTKEEIQLEEEEFANRFDKSPRGSSDGSLNDAESIRADVMGGAGRSTVDDEDDGPKEELTAGEIRYWKYQVHFHAVFALLSSLRYSY